MVHVSLLKKALHTDDQVSTDLPLFTMDFLGQVQPKEILQSRLIRCGNKLKPQVFISWSTLPDNCSTWENLFALVNAFPDAPAWGQAGSRGGGDVTATYLDRALQVKRRT